MIYNNVTLGLVLGVLALLAIATGVGRMLAGRPIRASIRP